MPLYELDGHRVETPGEGRYFVAPGATVVGRARLGAGVSVWPGAVIRADNEPILIGARTSIQEGCVLHVDPGFPMEIGEECTIGHKVTLHGCTVGRYCLIGIGSIILNGARIGEGTLVGAGTLIPEGKIIPPHSVVLGVPGKVIRQATEKDRARIQEGLDDYQQKWPLYLRALKAQTT